MILHPIRKICTRNLQELSYIERFNPDNPRQYEFEGRWLDVEVVQEEIHVKGRAEPLVE